MTGKAKALIGVLALLGAAYCGKDSNTMTGPVSVAPMASVAGTWSGTYSSNDPACASTPMTVTLVQNGGNVTGAWVTSRCGPNGALKATISGDSLTGSIEVRGCSGGGVSGHLAGGVLSLAIGDFYRPLVMQDQVMMQGGAATLSR